MTSSSIVHCLWLCNTPSRVDGPTWMCGIYQGNDESPRVLDSCRGQRPTMRQQATLGQATPKCGHFRVLRWKRQEG
jgi:hypothetical protein